MFLNRPPTHITNSIAPCVIYLGISGVLHPSATLFELAHRASPWDAGHKKYEAVHQLERVLARWPDARIVITSTQPWAHGLPAVLASLGPELAARVLSFTYEDLTQHARFGKFRRPLSDQDYWRLNKSDIVRKHVTWMQPAAWIAVDDEDILWGEDRAGHLVHVDGCKGLRDDSVAFDRLVTLMHHNFGPATGPDQHGSESC